MTRLKITRDRCGTVCLDPVTPGRRLRKGELDLPDEEANEALRIQGDFWCLQRRMIDLVEPLGTVPGAGTATEGGETNG